MGFYHASADGQPHAHAIRLVRVKGLENLLSSISGNTLPPVRNADLDFPVADRLERDGDHFLGVAFKGAHTVLGIVQQIGYNQLNSQGVGEHHRTILGRPEVDAATLALDFRSQHRQGLAEHGMQR